MWQGGKDRRSQQSCCCYSKKDVLVHKADNSVASIPVQEQKEEALSIRRKCKRKLEDLQASVKYHKIYHTKNTKREEEEEKKEEKNDFKARR